MMANSKIAIFMHNGVEEIEAVTIIDVLRRANLEVELVSLNDDLLVTGSHQIQIYTNTKYSNFKNEDYQGIVIPGGPGISNLFENEFLISTIKHFAEAQKMVVAICAAPQLLGRAEVVNNKQVTVYPGCTKFLDQADLQNQPYVIDQNIITGQSAGTAMKFALALVEYLVDQELAKEVATALVIK